MTAPTDPPAAGAPPPPGWSGPSGAPARALLVDDRPGPRTAAAAALRRVLPGVSLEVAASRVEALAALAAAGRGEPPAAPPAGSAAVTAAVTMSAADPFAFAVLRNGMAWGHGMSLTQAVRARLPRAPLIVTCDPDPGGPPADDPADALDVVARHGLGEVIPIAGDDADAVAAAASACLKLVPADLTPADGGGFAAGPGAALAAELDRLRAERDLAERKVDDLLRAAAKLAESEADDRRRLAGVLHEDMLQMLVAARMFLACGLAAPPAPAGDAGGGTDEPCGPDPLAEVDTLLIRSVQLCKDLTGLWSPLVLYEAGLVAALRWLGDAAGPPGDADRPDAPGEESEEDDGPGADLPGPGGPGMGALKVDVACDDDAEPATQDGRTLLYQAAVELLTNVSRHAGVDRALLSLRRVPGPGGEPDRLRLTVADRGRGFDADRVGAPDRPEPPATAGAARGDREDRFGLFSLRERLRLAGGSLEVESVVGRGTTVRVLCPAADGGNVRRPTFADAPDDMPADPPPESAASPAEASPAEASPDDPAAPNAAPIRVLLADDHRIIRISLGGLLRAAGGVEVIGEAVDGEEAVAKAAELRPDVVLMDVNMPRLDGVEATRRVKAADPAVRVIALSMHESDDRELDMFEAGAERYVVKDGPPDQLLRAIRAAPGDDRD